MRRWVDAGYSLRSFSNFCSHPQLTAAAHSNCQAHAAEFNHQGQELERAAIHCLIELEVVGPGVVSVFSTQQLSKYL
jgi:hypothetical protein